MTIDEYKNEIIKLQKEDTKNAIKKGFKDKIKEAFDEM